MKAVQIVVNGKTYDIYPGPHRLRQRTVPAELAEWLQALAATPVAALLRTSTVAYAALNAAHIFSIGLVVGSIATLDLRVLGALPPRAARRARRAPCRG